ncbi:MAG: hypothetical protein ACFFED_04795 [Candidatus Thorarchaeota archaeon]
MSWFGDYSFRGLEFARNRFGERAYRFILRMARTKTRSKSERTKLVEIGKLVGLNAAETTTAAAASKAGFTFPLWLKIVLTCIAIVGTLYIARQVMYIPGTLYASIKPNDFLINS